MTEQRPGLVMCVCTGKCPGFSKMDIWDFINRARVELPEFGVIHPQLCGETVLRHPLREPEYRQGRGHRDFMVTLRTMGIDAHRSLIEKVAIKAAQQVFGRVNALPELDVQLEQRRSFDSVGCVSRAALKA
jgi:hypothetical protein